MKLDTSTVTVVLVAAVVVALVEGCGEGYSYAPHISSRGNCCSSRVGSSKVSELTAMKPHPSLTATMPLRLTKELQQAVVSWFIERMCTRKLKRSVRHPKRYHLAKISIRP